MRDSLEGLPAEQRARRYREMANMAFREAQYINNPAERVECLRLAWSWHAMAQETEAAIKGKAQLQTSQEGPRSAGNTEGP
jgi:hypothetical protein